LEGQYGTIRSYYFDVNNNNAKTILDEDIGIIDYNSGVITLNDFSPLDVNDPFGLLTVTAVPKQVSYLQLIIE